MTPRRRNNPVFSSFARKRLFDRLHSCFAPAGLAGKYLLQKQYPQSPEISSIISGGDIRLPPLLFQEYRSHRYQTRGFSLVMNPRLIAGYLIPLPVPSVHQFSSLPWNIIFFLQFIIVYRCDANPFCFLSFLWLYSVFKDLL